MPYVKLDTGLLESSLWPEREAREVFITALLMARPAEVTEPLQALKTVGSDPLGFTVQPGWYGLVEAASVGILRRAGVDKDEGLEALQMLAEPDELSRTPDHDGRRMVRVPGGFVILNYDRYRTKDHTAAERSRRYRDRRKANGDTL